MDHSITILSEKEKAILESYMLSADGLAEFWGENCEVIIHDLTQLDASVVKIVNGHLSGRQVGAPISEVTLNFVNNDGNPRHEPRHLLCQKQTRRSL